MDIKVGDMVNILGHRQRVTKMGQRYVTLSRNGVFTIDEIRFLINAPTDIERVLLPQLNIGDWVIVNDITHHEKSRYGLMWFPEKNGYIGKIWPVTHIKPSEFSGQIVTLDDDQNFQIYHLEKINDYDIV